MQMTHSNPLPRRQRGAVLITGLLIMTIMTLIGLASMQSSIIQTNLATNSQLNTIGYQSAETALTQVANNATLLIQAMDSGLGKQTSSALTAYSVSLDTTSPSANATGPSNTANSGGTVTVNPTVQVTPCGALPINQCAGFGQDGDLGSNKTTPTCYAFSLTATIDINGQATTRHSLQAKRPIPGQQSAGAWSC